VARRIARPYMPRSGRSDRFDMIQNVYRCWRDFPDMGLARFIWTACVTYSPFGIRSTNDHELEMACYIYWVHNSGRATKRQIAELEKACSLDAEVEA
jgi:hypothetical protein